MATQLASFPARTTTSEIELLVFQLDGGHYAVHIAHVREIIAGSVLTRLPGNHPAVRGGFKLRDRIVPLVDLRRYLNMPAADSDEHCRIIVIDCNGRRLGLLVDQVDRIHRFHDRNPDDEAAAFDGQPNRGVLRVSGRTIHVLDVEQIACRIADSTGCPTSRPATADIDRADITILLAGDSADLRSSVARSLDDANYGRVVVTADGDTALATLTEMADAGCPPDVILTDIDVPGLNALHLTQRIKEDPRLKHLPVIVFGSRSSGDILKKCKAVGAARQLANPQFPALVDTIDDVLCDLAAV